MSLPGMARSDDRPVPHGGEVMDASDDPLWAAAAERKVPISIHVSFATQAQGDKKRMKLARRHRLARCAGTRARSSSTVPCSIGSPTCNLVLVEVDSGWIPYLREQMTDRYLRQSPDDQKRLARKPDEYFDTNIASTFITDEYGVANRHRARALADDVVERLPSWWLRLAELEDLDREPATAGLARRRKATPLAGNAARIYGCRILTRLCCDNPSRAAGRVSHRGRDRPWR